MPALNFEPHFARLVESGAKRQTIRPERVRPIKPGDPLYFHTGMRTPVCRSLGEGTCRDVRRIAIFERHVAEVCGFADEHLESADEFARKDGFEDYAEMAAWFEKRYGLPFEGVLIRW